MVYKFSIEETREIFSRLCNSGLGESNRCRQPLFFAQALMGEKYGAFHPFISYRSSDSDRKTRTKRRKTKKEVIRILEDYKVPYTFTKYGTLYVSVIEKSDSTLQVLTEALNPGKKIIDHAILGIACGYPLEDIFKFLKTTEQKYSRSELDELVQMYFPNYKPWDELGQPIKKEVFKKVNNPGLFKRRLEDLSLFSCYNRKRKARINKAYASTILNLLGQDAMEKFIIEKRV